MIARLQLSRLRRLGAVSRDVVVAGGTLHTLDVPGTGPLPPVILVHGLGARAAAYAPLVARLLPHVNSVVMPDLPGHGRSRWTSRVTAEVLRQSLLEALPALSPVPAVLYGNSLGGYCALWAAARAPNQVAGVMVTSPGGGALPDDERSEVLRRFRPTSHADAVALVERSLTSVQGARRHIIALGARHALKRPAVMQVVDSITEADDLSPADLARLQMPVRFFWGKEERAMSPAQLRWFQAHLPPHAEVIEPTGWGHSAFRERPAEVGAALVAFVQAI